MAAVQNVPLSFFLISVQNMDCVCTQMKHLMETVQLSIHSLFNTVRNVDSVYSLEPTRGCSLNEYPVFV